MIKSVLDGIRPAYRWLFLLVVLGLGLIFGQSRLWGGFKWEGGAGRGLPVERPRVLYLGFGENGNDQIYGVSPVTGQATQLTQTPLGVIDFSVSPDGAAVAFSVWRDDGGSDLWAMDSSGLSPLLACPGAACSGPVWTPEGERLVYEQRLLLPDDTLGQPRLWWFDPATDKTDPVFADEARYGFAAGLSPDGQWLSYLLLDTEGVQVYNINEGRGFVFPSQTAEPAVWHPQKNLLLITHFSPGEEEFAVHLLQVDPAQGSWIDLSVDGAPSPNGGPVEDSFPAWSPDGKHLAFTRKPALVSMGRQIWLMQDDGSEARYLTAEPAFYHGRPAWSPDGGTLAFHRFSLQDSESALLPGGAPSSDGAPSNDGGPGIWLLDVASGQMQRLVSPGRQPMWLP